MTRRQRRYTAARYPCPTCKRVDALSAAEKSRGYQCLDCTRRDAILIWDNPNA